MTLHRLFAGLGAALVVVGHNVPGPVGWLCMAVGLGVTTAADVKTPPAPAR